MKVFYFIWLIRQLLVSVCFLSVFQQEILCYNQKCMEIGRPFHEVHEMKIWFKRERREVH